MVLTNVVMTSMARAEPSPEIPTLSDGDATQVGAHAEHDEPLRFLHPRVVGLRVSETLEVHGVGFVNLLLGAMADEHGLATPFDNDVLACVFPGQYLV